MVRKERRRMLEILAPKQHRERAENQEGRRQFSTARGEPGRAARRVSGSLDEDAENVSGDRCWRTPDESHSQRRTARPWVAPWSIGRADARSFDREACRRSMIDSASVFVTYSPDEGDPVAACGHSGILIAKRWVLCHGSTLDTPLRRLGVRTPRSISNLFAELERGRLIAFPEQLTPPRFSVYRQVPQKAVSTVAEAGEYEVHGPEGSVVGRSTGRLAAIWKCPLLADTFEKSFEGWKFEQVGAFLPVFVVIELRRPDGDAADNDAANSPEAQTRLRKVERALVAFAKRLCKIDRSYRGSTVEIVSTPFGNPVFFESLTRGIVSNVLGVEGCVILTDANAFPGCEGGPLFVVSNSGSKRICGMVIAPSSSCRGESVDYTLAVNFGPTLRCLLRKELSQDLPYEIATRRTDVDHAGTLDRWLVVVRCGSSWGTGILVDEGTGTFLTCAHVVAEAPERSIGIAVPRGNHVFSMRARLIYKTAENMPYDVAVLGASLNTSSNASPDAVPLRAIKLAAGPPHTGQEVLSAGFPFFAMSEPTISSGIVSKTLDCMLQTSCCVQSGASGGPIVRKGTHEMLGMIVCNAVSSNGTTLYPRLSMAIPISVLREPLAEYIRTSDPRALAALSVEDVAVRRIWKLQPHILSRI